MITLDADTVIEPDAVGRLVRHFELPGNERLGGVAGVVKVGNRTADLLTRWQALEYITQIGVELHSPKRPGRSPPSSRGLRRLAPRGHPGGWRVLQGHPRRRDFATWP